MQLPNIKDFEPITSSRFEIDIIHMDGRLFYYAISPLLSSTLIAKIYLSDFFLNQQFII